MVMMTVRALLAALAVLAAPGLALAAKSALFIERAAVPGGSSDAAIKAHLEAQGWTVTVSEDVPAKLAPCDYDLVLLSSTVRSNQFTAERSGVTALRDLGAPLLTWENDLLDDLRLTGRARGSDFGELETGHYGWLVRAPHPLQAGLPSGAAVWTQARTSAGWGRPGLGADIIMTVPGEPTKAMLFGYERGATMDDAFPAPARRVFIGLDNASFERLTPDGMKLFEAAVAWTAADACDAGKRR